MKYKVNVTYEGGSFSKKFRTNLMVKNYVNNVLDEYKMVIEKCETNEKEISYLCHGISRIDIIKL